MSLRRVPVRGFECYGMIWYRRTRGPCKLAKDPMKEIIHLAGIEAMAKASGEAESFEAGPRGVSIHPNRSPRRHVTV